MRRGSSREKAVSLRGYGRVWALIGLVGFLAGPAPRARSAPAKAPAAGTKADQAEKKKKKNKKKDPNRLEWGVLPAIAGSTDWGIGFGLIGNLARFRPGYSPYRWRIQALWFMTLMNTAAGITSPYHYDYIKLDLPGLWGGRLRLNMKVVFARFVTSGYYGLGNASRLNPEWEDYDPDSQKRLYVRARQHYQWDHIYPYYQLNARIPLLSRLQLFASGEVSYDMVNLYPGSKLKEDLARVQDPSRQDPKTLAIRRLLFGVEDTANITLQAGLIWDSRDHEFAPSRGQFHELVLRGAVGIPDHGALGYGGVTAHFRFFFPLYGRLVVLAMRFMVDLLFGDVPFHKLPSSGGLDPIDATGGERSLRGVPSQRFYGKVKLLGNLELRVTPFRFTLWKQRFALGFLAFVDVGRFWADYKATPELDGTGIGIKPSMGGGLRLRWGESFVIRADFGYGLVPYSPFGVYVNVQHIF